MTIAIRCGSLLDGTGVDPIPGAVILIEDGQITAIGADVAVPADAEVIDASSRTVMPGLIDSHVHLVTLAGRTLQQRLATPYSLTIAEGYKNAEAVLCAGFTTVRDLSGMPLGGKMALDRGLFPGPRLKIAISALSQTAGHGDQMTAGGVNTGSADSEHPQSVVDGVDEVRRATRQLLRAGADQIKVYVSGGVMSDHDEPDATGFSPEELAVVAFEAHAAKKPVAAHAISREGARNAVLAGFDSIEHGMFLDEELIAEMLQRGTYLVPTLLAPVWIVRRAERTPGSIPAHMLEKVHKVKDAHLESFRLAVRSGVRIAFGSDTGVVPHGAAAEELELMVECGMTAMEAIIAATKTASELLGMDTMVGTLEPGKRADLLIVDGDPLTDIGVLAREGGIVSVIKDGALVDREGMRRG